MASVLPNVYLELSELIPWGWGQVEWALEMLVGTVPAAKLLYGSDEAGEPEAFWASALLARSALQRVLGAFVDRDYVSVDERYRAGQARPRRRLPRAPRPAWLTAARHRAAPSPDRSLWQ